tara:strand:+ start:4708 stop:4818 length:111 start_codon:yes stop_codon:yes gene_type:complete
MISILKIKIMTEILENMSLIKDVLQTALEQSWGGVD